MRYFLFLAVLTVALTACGHDPDGTRATIQTNLGDIEVLLYPSTPGHHDNFVKLAEQGFYDSTLFHRVIEDFMIQGGDPESKGAAMDVRLGQGGTGYELEAEIGAPHLRGALAAARTNNPEKKSNGSQFYIVTGGAVSDGILNNIERIEGIRYSDAQREAYKTIGGRPDLDNKYTVFGEVTDGMEVVEAISEMETNRANRPLQDVIIEGVIIE